MVFSVPDMHTHSENSHDSKCKIEDMMHSQIEKGTNIFAVTDHFDAYSYNDYDIFTPIKSSFDTVKALNNQYYSKCLMLSGIEISEAFWFPEIYEKIKNYIDFDVIIGSVHCVRNQHFTEPYSKFDFSNLHQGVLEEWLDIYFDDMLTMLKFMDFDILAHLTCPLRYIVGKYKRCVDISLYEKRIDKILNEIINRNIALEVNTSSFDRLNDFMPSTDMIKRYYEKGGRLITLGSDAHTPERASINFNKAVKILKEIGFDGVYYFEKRKPYKIDI